MAAASSLVEERTSPKLRDWTSRGDATICRLTRQPATVRRATCLQDLQTTASVVLEVSGEDTVSKGCISSFLYCDV